MSIQMYLENYFLNSTVIEHQFMSGIRLRAEDTTMMRDQEIKWYCEDYHVLHDTCYGSHREKYLTKASKDSGT